MKSSVVSITILVLVCAAVAAPAETRGPDEILLRDGNLLTGRVVEEREDVIVFETESLGRLEIPRAHIVRLARGSDRSSVLVDPDYNSLMLCPTPATLPKGDNYFRDFELFFLNFGAAITDAVDLSFGTMFPVSSEVSMLSLGAKWRLVDREERPVGLALTGSYTLLENIKFGAVGAVAGVGDRHNSINNAVSRTFHDDGDTETIFLAGIDGQLTRRSKLFAEYMSSSTLLEDDDLKGFVNLGVRIYGKTHSFSLSGFRPLTDDSGGLIAFPMVMYSNHW